MRTSFLAFLAVLAFTLCGCLVPRPVVPTRDSPEIAKSTKKSPDPAIRINALALLNNLMNDEKNLSKVLIIKKESKDLNRLVKEISATAAGGAKWMKTLPKADTEQMKETGLPAGEKSTRDAISKTKEHLLLHSKDDEFEFQILLTQSEGLNYGAHLARVAADNETNLTRAQELVSLSNHLNELHEQVLTMLRKHHAAPPPEH